MLSNGSLHPDAAINDLQCGFFPGGRVQLSILNDLLAMLTVDENYEDGLLAVWRWTSGELLGVSIVCQYLICLKMMLSCLLAYTRGDWRWGSMLPIS